MSYVARQNHYTPSDVPKPCPAKLLGSCTTQTTAAARTPYLERAQDSELHEQHVTRLKQANNCFAVPGLGLKTITELIRSPMTVSAYDQARLVPGLLTPYIKYKNTPSLPSYLPG